MNDVGTTTNRPSNVDVSAIYFINKALHKYNEALTDDANIFDLLLTSIFFITRNTVSNSVANIIIIT